MPLLQEHRALVADLAHAEPGQQRPHRHQAGDGEQGEQRAVDEQQRQAEAAEHRAQHRGHGGVGEDRVDRVDAVGPRCQVAGRVARVEARRQRQQPVPDARLKHPVEVPRQACHGDGARVGEDAPRHRGGQQEGGGPPDRGAIVVGDERVEQPLGADRQRQREQPAGHAGHEQREQRGLLMAKADAQQVLQIQRAGGKRRVELEAQRVERREQVGVDPGLGAGGRVVTEVAPAGPRQERDRRPARAPRKASTGLVARRCQPESSETRRWRTPAAMAMADTGSVPRR